MGEIPMTCHTKLPPREQTNVIHIKDGRPFNSNDLAGGFEEGVLDLTADKIFCGEETEIPPSPVVAKK